MVGDWWYKFRSRGIVSRKVQNTISEISSRELKSKRRKLLATTGIKLFLLLLFPIGTLVWLAVEWPLGAALAATIAGGVATGIALIVTFVGTRSKVAFWLLN